MASIWPLRTFIIALVAPSNRDDADEPRVEPLGIDVGRRVAEHAELPDAAAGLRQAEIGQCVDGAAGQRQELELEHVVGPRREVVAGSPFGQLVAVDDNVDLAPREDLEQVLPEGLLEDRRDVQLASRPGPSARPRSRSGRGAGCGPGRGRGRRPPRRSRRRAGPRNGRWPGCRPGRRWSRSRSRARSAAETPRRTGEGQGRTGACSIKRPLSSRDRPAGRPSTCGRATDRPDHRQPLVPEVRGDRIRPLARSSPGSSGPAGRGGGPGGRCPCGAGG